MVLHVVSSMPLAIWTIEDPLAVGIQAGRCACLPIGSGSDWSLRFRAEDKVATPGMVSVNGSLVQLGSVQLLWVPGASGVLLHSPMDVLAPLMLVERPHKEDVRAEVFAT